MAGAASCMYEGHPTRGVGYKSVEMIVSINAIHLDERYYIREG